MDLSDADRRRGEDHPSELDPPCVVDPELELEFLDDVAGDGSEVLVDGEVVVVGVAEPLQVLFQLLHIGAVTHVRGESTELGDGSLEEQHRLVVDVEEHLTKADDVTLGRQRGDDAGRVRWERPLFPVAQGAGKGFRLHEIAARDLRQVQIARIALDQWADRGSGAVIARCRCLVTGRVRRRVLVVGLLFDGHAAVLGLARGDGLLDLVRLDVDRFQQLGPVAVRSAVGREVRVRPVVHTGGPHAGGELQDQRFLLGDLVVARLRGEGLQIGQALAARLQRRDALGEGHPTFGHEGDESTLSTAALGEVLQDDVGEVRVAALTHAVREVEQDRSCVGLDLILAHLAVAVGVDLLLEGSVVGLLAGSDAEDLRGLLGRSVGAPRCDHTHGGGEASRPRPSGQGLPDLHAVPISEVF